MLTIDYKPYSKTKENKFKIKNINKKMLFMNAGQWLRLFNQYFWAIIFCFFSIFKKEEISFFFENISIEKYIYEDR